MERMQFESGLLSSPTLPAHSTELRSSHGVSLRDKTLQYFKTHLPSSAARRRPGAQIDLRDSVEKFNQETPNKGLSIQLLRLKRTKQVLT